MNDLEEMRAELRSMRRDIGQTSADRAWKIAGRVATTLALPALVGFGGWLSDLAERVAGNSNRILVLETNEFTADDGRRLIEQIRQELRDNYPPEWLRQAVTRLEGQATRLAEKLDKLDDRLDLVELRGKDKDK